MSQQQELLYQLHDSPPFWPALNAGFQHILASFVAIVTPTLIIGSALNLADDIPYLISMALIASGVGSFIQTRGKNGIGSGLVTIQGTSFAFISSLIIAGNWVRQHGGDSGDVIAMLNGLTIAGAAVELVVAAFITHIKRIITPVTTGIVIIAIGLSLIKVGMTDLAGGFNNPALGSDQNLLIGLSVLLTILFLNASSKPSWRLSSIFVGMLVGTVVAYFTGAFAVDHIQTSHLMVIPVPFKYGLDFEWSLFIPIALVYFFSALETAGDLTANSAFCQLPTSGPSYLARIKRGILADGINSMLAGVLNSFPNTTFGQNNGVLQLTGIASRKVGFFAAGLLVLFGLFPIIGAALQALPKPVIGGATLIMFGMVAVGGVKILTSQPLDRIDTLITAASLGAGFGVMMVPQALAQQPQWLQNLLASPVTTSGLVAIFLTLVLHSVKRHSFAHVRP